MRLTPEERRELIDQAGETRRALRVVLTRVLVVVYVILMVFLVLMLRAAQDSLQRTFVCVWMVIATAWILSNPLHDDPLLKSLREQSVRRRTSPPSCMPDGIQETPEKHDVEKCAGEVDLASSEPGNTVQGGQPSEPRKIEDLNELPPELASNADFQKLFQDARNLGGRVWLGSVGTTKESGGSQEVPPGLAANPDVQKLLEDARALGGRVEITKLRAQRRSSFGLIEFFRAAGIPGWLILIALFALLGLAFIAFQSFLVGLVHR